MIIKMFLVADPLLVPADGVQVGGGGVGRPAEHLQHQGVEPAIIIATMMMMTSMMMKYSLLHVHVVISGVKSSLIIIPTEPGSYQDDDDDKSYDNDNDDEMRALVTRTVNETFSTFGEGPN